MYNKNNIIEDLKNIGIKKGDVVLLHSSYKSLGEIEGGAKTFFEAFGAQKPVIAASEHGIIRNLIKRKLHHA